MEHHQTNPGSSRRERKEANQRFQEINDLSEVLSRYTSGDIDKYSKVHARFADWNQKQAESYGRVKLSRL